MLYTRRKLTKMLLALPAAGLVPDRLIAQSSSTKPDSKFNGVQIGVIISPYNYPSIPLPADQLLPILLQLGLSAVEMQTLRVEAYAGAPEPAPSRGRRSSGSESRREAAKALQQWRLSAPFEKYTALRRLYDKAGVRMYALRVADVHRNTLASDFDYFFHAAHLLGADQITMELPADPALSQRIGDLASQHKLMVGYHNHTQVNYHSWDVALSQSKWNGINLDIGHLTAAINGSPIPFIEEHHNRITSIHLKDRKYLTSGGQNMPWGDGQTPVRAVLQLMRTRHYAFPAAIELEYPIPAGSTPTEQIAKCLSYCKNALS